MYVYFLCLLILKRLKFCFEDNKVSKFVKRYVFIYLLCCFLFGCVVLSWIKKNNKVFIKICLYNIKKDMGG